PRQKRSLESVMAKQTFVPGKVQDGYRLTPLGRWGRSDAPPASSPTDPGIDGKTPPLVLVEQVEQLADLAVVLDHAIGVEAEAGLALRLLLQVREDVHARGVEVAEPRCAGLVLALDEALRCGEKLLVDGFHALLAHRAGVLDHLLADLAVGRVVGGVVLV